MGEKSNDKQKIKLNKYGWLIIIILALCILGLSTIKVSSVAIKDVVVSNSGNDGSWSVTSVVPGYGSVYSPAANDFAVAINAGYTVSWTASSDLNNWAPAQTGSAYFGAGSTIGVNSAILDINYAMQAALKT